MKKLSTALILLLASFSVAMATEYNGKLKVTINGASTYQDDVFTVNDNGDGTYTFYLRISYCQPEATICRLGISR